MIDRLPLTGAVLAALVALATLVERWVWPSALPRLAAWRLPAAPATASALLLAAASLYLVRYRAARRRSACLAARLAALGVIVIGVAVAWRYVDPSMAAVRPEAISAGRQSWAARPAPNTTIALLLLGASLLALSATRERLRALAPPAAAGVLVVALVALVGHAYGASALYGLNRLGGMTVNTAVACIVLGLGVVFADPTRGIAAIFVGDSAGSRLLRRLAPATIVLPPLLGWVRLQGQRAGLFDTRFGLALLVVALVVVYFWLLASQARALHVFDRERGRLHAAERAARADAELARITAERARREADQANQAKSAFLATMSHEIRTPINAITGYAQLMELGVAGPVTEQQREYLARLTASSAHLRGLIDDILDLAKVDAGGMAVAREPALTGALVGAALDLVRPQASARGVQLVDGRPGDPGEPFVGDEHRVRQILANLLSNAVKFTPAGGTVTIGCGRVDATPSGTTLRGEGPWTFVAVADTGIGIAPAEQARIFEPFHQVDAGHTRQRGGTGLGLAISRRLAHLMGGDVTVESALGAGSTFTLWLPAPTAGAAPRESAAQRVARARQEAGAGRVRGLAELGLQLRERAGDVVLATSTRLRADPAFPQAAHLRRSELEDHQVPFVTDVAQTLITIDESGAPVPDLLLDSSTIQRVVAELHGTMRQQRGWTDEQLAREYAILREEIAAAIHGGATAEAGDVSLALDVVDRLIDRATELGRAALRRAAESGGASVRRGGP